LTRLTLKLGLFAFEEFLDTLSLKQTRGRA
jgi:hypothetical protein